jgi:hypothetical protein
MIDPDGAALSDDQHVPVDDLRKAAWYSFTGGAAGWGGFSWDWDTAARTSTVLTYYKNLQDFIDNTGVQFWRMTPQHSSISNSTYNSLLANPGVEYVVYVLSDASVTITLASGYYSVRYFNPITGAFTGGAGVSGGARTFNRPSGASDWVVYLSAIISGQLNITTTTLPNRTVGTTYSQTLVAAGGVSPYTWDNRHHSRGLSISRVPGSFMEYRPPTSRWTISLSA